MLGFSSLRITLRFQCAVTVFVLFAGLAHQHSAVELEKQQYNEDPEDINVIPEMDQLKIKKSRVIRADGDKTEKPALPSTPNRIKEVNLNETIEALNSLRADGKKNTKHANSLNNDIATQMNASSVEHPPRKVTGYTTLLPSGTNVTSFTSLPNVTGNSSLLPPSANVTAEFTSHPHKSFIHPANVTGVFTLPPVANVTGERPTFNVTDTSAATSPLGNEERGTPLPDPFATGKTTGSVMSQKPTTTTSSGDNVAITSISGGGGGTAPSDLKGDGETSAALKLHRLSFAGALFAVIGAIFLVFT